VDVGTQVADPVKARGRGVGDDGHVGIVEALPGRLGRIELEPGGAELEVIRLGSSPHAVDAVCHSLEEAGLDKSRQGAPGYGGCTGLLERDEAPLPFGNVAEAAQWTRHAAKYNTGVILCSRSLAPAVGFEPTTK
jgi:hypothetical protein